MNRNLALLPVFLLLACDSSPVESAGACDADHACEVPGVDVALLSVIPRWTAAQPYEAEAGAHVVDPGDTLTVDVVLVNRGTADATDSILVYGFFRDFQHFVSAAKVIGPLAVGADSTVTLRFLVPEGVRWVRRPGSGEHAEGYFALDGDFEEDDVDPSNHEGARVLYQPLAPILDVELGDFPDTMGTHRAYERVVEVTNRSPFESYAGGDDLVFCMSHLGHGYCEAGLVATHSPTTIGAVPADETVEISHVMAFTGESLWYFDSESYVMVNPCLPGAQRPTCLHAAESGDDFDVVAIPNLTRECHTAALVPPDTLRAVDALCLGDGADQGTTYTIGVFTGQEGDCFRVTRLGVGWTASVKDANLALVPRDPTADCHRLPHDGDYYLIGYTVGTADPAGGIIAIEPI